MDLRLTPAWPAGLRRPPHVRHAHRLMLFEAATFVAAASLHSGLLPAGVAHAPAARAELVIAVVLVSAVVLGRMPDPWPLRSVVGAQAFALAGVLVGLVAIATGAGPRSIPDLGYHVVMVPILIAGIATSAPHNVVLRTSERR